MNADRQVQVRVGLGLGVIALTLLLLPLGLNYVRGGAAGVGVDPRTQGSDMLFAVTWERGLVEGPLDGRLVLVVARDSAPEPRFRVGAGPSGQQVFGLDARGWEAGTPLEVNDSVFGFPLASLALIPPGDYWVQGVLDLYRPVQAGGGPTVLLPARASGVGWNRAPGNLASRPVRVRIDPRSDDVIRVDLSRLVSEPTPPDPRPLAEEVWVSSERLSAFWGREVRVGASVRLPVRWQSRPDARYPVIVGFDADRARGEEPWPEEAETDAGRPVLPAVDRPEALLVEIRGASPFFAGFLPVNSENLGPWADALVLELLPEVEARFRGIAQPWGRALHGGDGPGWAALAALQAYPGAWAGAWAPCAGDLRATDFAGASLHAGRNAYLFDRAWGRTPRPGWVEGVAHTLEQENHLELVLGSRGRSGGWWDGWQAAYSPRGEDGLPLPVWDKRSGEVHAEVAAEWRERADLAALVDRAGPAPGLAAKLHLGGAGGVVAACGGPAGGGGEAPGTLTLLLPEILGELARGAPPGADTSWR